MEESPLTDLEGAVLGLLWRSGPLTAYQIRTEFLHSPTSHWSGSAGAIYPLMRRLEEIGLVGSEEESTGRRPRRRYQLTAAGLAALRGWLAPPHPADAYTVLFDPLRTRILFLDALDSAAQRLFLEEAEAGLERHLQELEEIYRQIQESGDRPAVLATRAGILSTRARLQWLAELRAAVSED